MEKPLKMDKQGRIIGRAFRMRTRKNAMYSAGVGALYIYYKKMHQSNRDYVALLTLQYTVFTWLIAKTR